MDEQEAERIVVGLPLTLRGEHGEQARETEEFVLALRGVLDVPVETYDERFTTALAGRGSERGERARGRARSCSSAGELPCVGGLEMKRALLAAAAALVVLGAAACGGEDTPPPRRGPAAARAAADHLSRGLHGERDGGSCFARCARSRSTSVGSRRGSHSRDIASAAAAARPPREFRKDWDGESIEGFLFPATYEFTKLTSSQRLVRDQVRAFARNWNRVDLRYARSKNLTPYDVLIIASMVEKEAVAARERPLVAAVIYNRLKAGMVLGIDATIRYGRNVPGTESLSQSDIESDNPYNTRRVAGLPPTPIANPGLASIRAAARPAKVDYLFFVRKPDEVHHFFTASESEFQRKSCEYGFSC